MNYHNITHCDMLNGSGIRVTLWVAGCNHHCKNCQNPFTWDVHGGIPFDKNAYDEICNDLKQEYCSGLSLSGGDPMHPDNRDEILKLCKDIKNLFPKKEYYATKNFYTTLATVTAGIVSSNIVTPIVRNKMANKMHKKSRTGKVRDFLLFTTNSEIFLLLLLIYKQTLLHLHKDS